MYTAAKVKNSLVGLSTDQHASFALQVADFFRQESNLPLLKPLLTNEDVSVVTLSSWVAGEVVDVNSGRELFCPLCNLLDHALPSVRFEVIKPVAALIQPADKDELVRLLVMVADMDANVRSRALRITCMVDDSLIRGMEEHSIWDDVRLLLPETTKTEIEAGLRSNALPCQRFAVGGIARNRYGDDNFLASVRDHFDSEVAGMFDTLPKGKRY